jgi:hypothetical protein
LLLLAFGNGQAAVFTVTSMNDFGGGTLRQAILSANGSPGADEIRFNMAGPGPYTIRILSQLPVITDAVTIDGTTQPGFGGQPLIEISGLNAGPNVSGLGFSATSCVVRGLIINNLQLGNGIEIYGGGNHVIQGNYIGTDRTGTMLAGNDWSGILIYNGGSGNLIGGLSPEDGNVIANNRLSGIHLADSSRGNVVQGNWIGTDFTGANRMGNRFYGIHIQDSSQNTLGGTNLGAANVIAFNEGAGVFVESGINNTILGNFIDSNGGLGIDLGPGGVNPNDDNDSDAGANRQQNYPVIMAVTTNADDTITIHGLLRSRPNAVFTLEFFASPASDPSEFGEGGSWLGRTNVTTATDGNRSFALSVTRPAGGFISATATDASGNTSEFSYSVPVGGVLPPSAELGTTLNATNLAWTTGGQALWLGQTVLSHDGVAAARSGAIADFQESWVQTTVNGPGTLTFWWKVSSEMDFDRLEFSIDGASRRSISGEEDWEQPSFALAAGSHTLRWRYFKDESVGLGLDRAWVDEVTFVADAGPPLVLAQPISQRVGLDDTVTLVGGVGGGMPRTYQWYRDAGEAIDGATSASLTLPRVSRSDAGSYHVRVSNAAGSTTSSNALLTVTSNGPVQSALLLFDRSFRSLYGDALNNLGFAHQAFSDNAAFNAAVAAADPASTLVIVDVPDANAVLNGVGRFANAGGRSILQYWALDAGSAVAAAFHASVVPPLLTVPQPVSDWGSSPFFAGVSSPLSLVDRLGHDGEMLQAVAGGVAVAGYSSLPAANQAALVIGHAGRTILSGFMLVEVNEINDGIRLAQNQLELFLLPSERPTILAQPVSQNVRLGRSVTNTVMAISLNGPLTYQWRFNGMDLSSATNSSLVITNFQLSDEGAYSVVVMDSLGTTTSSDAILLAVIDLAFTQSILSQSVVAGGNVTLGVEITGHPPPFGYDWRRVSPATSLASNVSNERVAFFTLTNVQTTGLYRITIRNAPNINGVSRTAVITVLPDANRNGLPDAWESAYPTATNPALDTDNDGSTNLEEYQAGTDPTDPASVLRIESIHVGESVTVEFPAVSNKTYTVQYTDDFNPIEWLTLADVLPRSSNRTEVVIDPVSRNQRHYRVVTPRQE